MLALEFKQYKSDTSVYYFIDEETRELFIAIIYVDVWFMSSKDFPLLLELKQKFMTKWEFYWQKSSKKEVMLRCNKNYTLLALNCRLKNSKETISASQIKRRGRNNNIKEE